MNIILVSWEFFARVNLHHSYLTISILPRSIIVNVPTHLEIRALKEFREIKPSLQELQQKVEVNIIFLFPHLGSWKLAVKGVLRSDRLIVQYSVNCASARLGDLTFSQVKFYKIAAYSETISDTAVLFHYNANMHGVCLEGFPWSFLVGLKAPLKGGCWGRSEHWTDFLSDE